VKISNNTLKIGLADKSTDALTKVLKPD